MDTALRALNRFGLGARPGEASRLSDPRGWLEGQLDGGDPTLPAPSGDTDPGALLRATLEAQRSQDVEAADGARRRLREHSVAEISAALTARVATDRPFVERWVAFWSNHLCVSGAGKLPTAAFAGSYERDVIRRHALGRFEDMVLASARHPAMLTYLDNAQSVGPESRGAQMASRRRRGPDRPPVGLNENYARELLELHTLGVNGGYTQDDVRELARILTGWSVSGIGPMARQNALRRGAGRRGPDADGQVGFAFQSLIHEPGSKTVLGRRYSDDGEDEGVAVIRDLSRHPATATFVASKLVRHFVSDADDPASVDRVAAVFRDTEGDLREVARAVVHLESAWDPERAKFRTPQDWLVALLRGVDSREVPPAVLGVLQALRQPMWAPPSPKGYGDTVADWADPDSLMNRAELARTVSRTALGRGGAAGRSGGGGLRGGGRRDRPGAGAGAGGRVVAMATPQLDALA
ncbi:MAG: DUF1800 domain-containing protein, partial [Gemmatimonadetes bacterium]|nr:DUF1800 domain-containing protein [Gemmatimonadota bacterium]